MGRGPSIAQRTPNQDKGSAAGAGALAARPGPQHQTILCWMIYKPDESDSDLAPLSPIPGFRGWPYCMAVSSAPHRTYPAPPSAPGRGRLQTRAAGGVSSIALATHRPVRPVQGRIRPRSDRAGRPGAYLRSHPSPFEPQRSACIAGAPLAGIARVCDAGAWPLAPCTFSGPPRLAAGSSRSGERRAQVPAATDRARRPATRREAGPPRPSAG